MGRFRIPFLRSGRAKALHASRRLEAGFIRVAALLGFAEGYAEAHQWIERWAPQLISDLEMRAGYLLDVQEHDAAREAAGAAALLRHALGLPPAEEGFAFELAERDPFYAERLKAPEK